MRPYSRHNTADRIALVVWGLSAVCLFVILLSRTSVNLEILGRFSKSYTLLLSAVGAATFLQLGIISWLWRQLPSLKWCLPFQYLGISALSLGAGVSAVVLATTWLSDDTMARSLFAASVFVLATSVLFLVYHFSALPDAESAENAFYLGILGIPGVFGVFFGGALGVANLAAAVALGLAQRFQTQWHSTQLALKSFPAWRVSAPAASLVAIAIWWHWTFASNPGDFFYDDELLHLAYVVTHPLGSSLLQKNFLNPEYYRPFYDIQAGIDYFLFGLNLRAWHLSQWVLLLSSLILLFVVLRRLGLGAGISLLLVFAFGSSAPVVFQNRWAVDVTTALASTALVVALLLQNPTWRRAWYFALGLCLLLSIFMKETGFAIVGAVWLYALEGARTRRIALRQCGLLSALSFFVMLIYFSMRLPVVGLPSNTVFNGSGYLFNYYSGPELAQFDLAQRGAFHLYTIAAHLIHPFFPFFEQDGMLLLWVLAPALSLLITLGIVLFAWGRAYTSLNASPDIPTNRHHWSFAVMAWAAAGASIPLAINIWNLEWAAWGIVLQIVISAGIFWGILFALPKDSPDRLLAAFGVGIIVALSIVTFSYFGGHHQYLSMLGWTILLGLCFKHLHASGLQRALRSLLFVLTLMLVFANSYGAHNINMQPLDVYDINPYSTICQSFFPSAVAEQLAAAWNLNPEQLAACRAIAVR